MEYLQGRVKHLDGRGNYYRARVLALNRRIEKMDEARDKELLDTRKPLIKILQIVQGECITGPCTHPDAIIIAEIANEGLGGGISKPLYVADKPSHRRKG